MINDIELRPDCNVIISRSEAYSFLSESKSEIENITAKYYEIIATSSKYTAFTANVEISDFFDRISDTFGEAYGILGSVSSQGSNQNSDGNSSQTSNSNSSSADTDTIAGETTSNPSGQGKPSSKIDVVGLAVFKGDILVR